MLKIIEKKLVEYPFLPEPLSLITFDNGHRLVLAKKESPMVNVSTWVKTGSINENADNNGVSHFLEHLMFKGTHKYRAGEFDCTLERKGGIINAATWKDYTFYYVTIPKAHLALALHMHADMMIDPVLPDYEIGSAFDPSGIPPKDGRERCVVIEEIRMGQDRSWRKVYDKLNDAMYQKHPYKRNVIGTKEIIARISRDDILAYYQNFYTPSNMTTIVVGEFDEEEIIKMVQDEFKFQNIAPAKRLTPDDRTPEIQIAAPGILEETAEIQTGYIMAGFLADKAGNLKESIALDLISVILGEGKSSRLNRKFIETPEKPHFYQIDTCHYQFKDGDNFFIEANFDAGFKDEVIAEIRSELDLMANVTVEELKKAKKRLKVNFAEAAETVSEIADTIGHYMTVMDDVSLANEYLKTLDGIDTTYIESVVKKYLTNDKCSISILMPKA